MPSVNIYTDKESVLQLKPILIELKKFIAGELSCKDRSLKPEEISIRLIVPAVSASIAQTELVITAYSYPERVEKQDKICLEIKNFLISRTHLKSVYVWLQLSELGHSE